MDTSKWVRGDEFLAELASARGDPPRPAPDPVDELAQAISYIESRLKRMNDSYRDTWPRWNNSDMIHVSRLLDAARTLDKRATK